jgi:hypothetical protein
VRGFSFGAGPRNDGIGHRSASLLIKAMEEGSNQSGDLHCGVSLQEIPLGGQVRAIRMWHQSFEARREGSRVEQPR